MEHFISDKHTHTHTFCSNAELIKGEFGRTVQLRNSELGEVLWEDEGSVGSLEHHTGYQNVPFLACAAEGIYQLLWRASQRPELCSPTCTVCLRTPHSTVTNTDSPSLGAEGGPCPVLSGTSLHPLM